MPVTDLSPIDFETLRPADIATACDRAIALCDAGLAEIVAIDDSARTFDNTLYALESTLEHVVQVSGAYAFMAHVSNDADLRTTAREWDERLDNYLVGVQFREDVYAAISAYAATDDAAGLEGAERRLLDRVLRDYRRNGFELKPEGRARVQALFEELITLGNDFRNAIADWEDGIDLDRGQLAGLPDSYVAGLRTVERDGKTVYRVGLDYPELHPFMANAEDEGLRRQLFVKDQCKGGAANIERLERAIQVRGEIARLLGYGSWAAYALETRMAKAPGRVADFLAELGEQIGPKLRSDMASLEADKAADGDGPLQIWDWRYYHTQRLKGDYHVDDFAVAEYFPLDACLEGLFDVTQRLLGVRYEAVEDAPVWDPEVKAFDVYETDGQEPFARFYMDLFPRPNTYNHAAAFTLRRGRRLADGSYQRPISAIVANFTKAGGDRPSLLRHQEVVTLFHEFGHILHQCLTRAPYARFSGTATERDFVEAPSQMLEHWCWDRDVLRSFARHYETGETIPDEMVDAMVGAKTLDSGVMTARQVFFATLDFTYHSTGFEGDTTATFAKLHDMTGFDYVEGTHFQSGFGHLFGYDAGYYGYLWSHVFGDDMFTRFEEAGLLDPAIGRTYRETILEPGGTVDGDVMVRTFLGREPSNAAFLRGLGLDA